MESVGVRVDLKEVGKIRRVKVLQGLKGEEESLKVHVIFDREPVEMLKNRSDMISGGSSGNDTSS